MPKVFKPFEFMKKAMAVGDIWRLLQHGFGRSLMFKHSAILLGSSTVAALFTYLFNLFIGKTFSPAEYSAFGVLFSIFLVMSTAFTQVGFVIIRFVSEFLARGQTGKVAMLLRYATRAAFIAGLIVFAADWVFSRQISALLKIPTVTPVIFLGVFLWAHFVVAMYFAFLNGAQKFLSLGLNRIVETSVVLVVGVTMVRLGFGVPGAIFGMMIGAIATLPVSRYSLRAITRVQPIRLGHIGFRKYFLFATLVAGSIALIQNIDLILVKILFSEHNAGLYSATVIMGSVGFFISTIFAAVVFPKAAKAQVTRKDSVLILIRGLLYTFLAGMGMILAYFFLPSTAVNLLYGPDFQPIGQWLWIYAVAMLFLSLSNIFSVYSLALQDRKVVFIVMPMLAVKALAVWLFHPNIQAVVYIVLLIEAVHLWLHISFNLHRLKDYHERHILKRISTFKLQGRKLRL